VDAVTFRLRNLAGLEHNENITEIHLRWAQGPSVQEFLPMLKRCTNLHRLTLTRVRRPFFPPLSATPGKLCDFIMELKQLTFLHIIYCFEKRKCNHLKSGVNEVDEFVLPRRPNFEFYLSCCC